MSQWEQEDLNEVPDGSGADPHPMGPHGNPDQRFHQPLEGEIVLEEGEVMDSRD